MFGFGIGGGSGTKRPLVALPSIPASGIVARKAFSLAENIPAHRLDNDTITNTSGAAEEPR